MNSEEVLRAIKFIKVNSVTFSSEEFTKDPEDVKIDELYFALRNLQVLELEDITNLITVIDAHSGRKITKNCISILLLNPNATDDIKLWLQMY